jgi:hypothetical protein
LAGFINRQPATTSPKGTTVRITPSTTVRTTTSTTTTPSTTTSSTTQPTTTTSRIISTAAKILPTGLTSKFSDADDIAFLNSLVRFINDFNFIKLLIYFYLQRNYAGIINLTTERSALANRILELALNRTGKSVPKQPPKNQIDLAESSLVKSTQSPEVVVKQISETRDNINLMNGVLKQNRDESNPMKLSPSEVERTKQMLQKDISQYNNDIKLLSLLVGKPITNQDISKLAQTNLGLSVRGNSIRSIATPTTTSLPISKSTLRLTPNALPTSSIPAFKPLSANEAQFLEALEQIQTTSTSTTTTQRTRTVSKSQEAIINALLKQQGFGPNSQVPIEVNFKSF